MEEHRLVVFADGTVLGRHPGITALQHGFAFVAASGEDFDDRLAGLSVRDERREVEIGQGSYLVTASLQLLGLAVRPARR